MGFSLLSKDAAHAFVLVLSTGVNKEHLTLAS